MVRVGAGTIGSYSYMEHPWAMAFIGGHMSWSECESESIVERYGLG
jgi:hypothetical protein